MKRMLSLVFALILLLSLSACIIDYEDAVASIVIPLNAVKDVYDVDEELNLDPILLTVTYKSGQEVTIPCTIDMIVGFDTTTTGDKTFYISYKNVKSVVMEYKVVNKGNETVNINTSCRLASSSEALINAASYSFNLNNGDLKNIKAIIFTIKSTSDLGVNVNKTNLEITNLLSGWQAESDRIDKNTLKILLFKISGMDIDTTLPIATVNIIEQNKVSIVVSNIIVSDGEKDYFLPNIK